MADLLAPLIDHFHARTPIRAGSLVVTVFGDAVVPRGGVLSLESLLAITRAFRIGDGVVRTALSRLVADGWFERWKLGRNSFYRLTGTGAAAFARATARIYGPAAPAWSGAFDLLLLDGADKRAELAASGYGSLGPDLMIGAAPSADGTAGEGIAGEGLLRLAARPDNPVTARRLAARAWPVAEVGERYARFTAIFAQAGEAVTTRRPDGLDALVLRILLIHEYRRAVLKDPLLPADLLPEGWPGAAARSLCATIYRAIAPAAEAWLDANATSDTGPLPPPGPAFAARFAG
ncbi:PaaX family transcriptional regulator C-terminal domain-containing protein [Methylobacterium nonmethylotrophicum]|uniref:Phenylacetic acid degradation operon negative regulatory protein PaaX n=1 Tax=Methylobacterium nonmethylotrophicum TaxID=1141884 RepID=A0A4Z0NV37_9HYPH|nr:PaaX family transcriptional regulator C-terminal domain-containing protein [Methylobacterium nonmethylotrophicum]TGE00562.1 phenylacetic acid degradation operon negative regulatory protein PaaX [Methylobacterium nonmethylotrophicum]